MLVLLRSPTLLFIRLLLLLIGIVMELLCWMFAIGFGLLNVPVKVVFCWVYDILGLLLFKLRLLFARF